MSLNFSDNSLPPHFSGIVRLFPLPNLVLFPGVVQALHIFEPRYRKMTEDALAADNLISVCLYKGEAQEEWLLDEASPAVHQTICIGKVVANKELEDGRFNLIIAGVKRAKILRELAIDQPYRMAEVQLIEDVVATDTNEVYEMRKELLEACKSSGLLDKLTANKEFKKIIGNDLSLGLLVDLVAFVANIDCLQRQRILEIDDVNIRCKQLVEFLFQSDGFREPQDDSFPPNFSDN